MELLNNFILGLRPIDIIGFALIVVVMVSAYVIGLLREMRTDTRQINMRLQQQYSLPEESEKAAYKATGLKIT